MDKYEDKSLQIYREYSKNLNSALMAFEVYRKKEFNKIILIIFFTIIIICALTTAVIYFFGFASLKYPAIILIAPILILILCCSCFYIKYVDNSFRVKLKDECLNKIIKSFGNVTWYNHSDATDYYSNEVVSYELISDEIASFELISNKMLMKSGLFADFNIRRTDDEFKGVFNGVPFLISEINIKYVQETRKHRKVFPVFKGIVISFKSNKTIKNRTIAATKRNLTSRNSALYPSLGVILTSAYAFRSGFNIPSLVSFIVISAIVIFIYIKIQKKEEPLNKVTLEDPKFNRKFNAYSSDQIEARYLLTTTFMKRLHDLKTTFGKTIKCSFFDDNLMIAISTKRNLFELGSVFHSLLSSKHHEKLFNDMYSVMNMVDFFKLDEKTKI